MSENTPAKRDSAPPAKPQIAAGGAIQALIPRDIEQAFRLAEALAGSGEMVPKHFQGRPREVMAALMKGMEIGLAPMQALASIAVINGRPTVWGDAIPGLVQRAGHHLDCDLEGADENMVAVARLTRGDTGKVYERRFSMADAKRAGLLGKQGPWTQYPQRMLMMRARTWAARDGASDALMGLSVGEEVQDYGPEAARDITPRPARGRAVYVAPTEPAPTPEVDEIFEHQASEAQGDPAPAEADGADDMTPEQRAQEEAAYAAWQEQQAQEAARQQGSPAPAQRRSDVPAGLG